LKHYIGVHLLASLSIDQAIGLMHVHGHKDECFFHNAPSFIPGSGIVAGEILESLWSSLNSISPTVRTATLPHQAEMLDDHATDSNRKKMLSMTVTLCSKSQEALEISTQLSKHHADLTAAFGQQAIKRWEDEVTTAEVLRLTDVKVMDMYTTQGSELASRMGIALGTALGMALGMALGPEMAVGARSASSTGSTLIQSVVEQWIDFAIVLEQRQ
jgi:hypothetical protein